VDKARRDLDADHYGMSDVKERLLEYLAVRQLTARAPHTPGRRGAGATILCLVGPPGVGKTSIAKSIALTLGRRFVRYGEATRARAHTH
jgi:ATP-dependent Lon protease